MASQTGHFGVASPLHARWVLGNRADAPLLVCLHGGGYDDRYFDAPHNSPLDAMQTAGYTAVSLTRPGYPAIDESASAQPGFRRAAHIVKAAVDAAWDNLAEATCPGVILIGHSIGAAVAVHLAAQDPDWPLLGLAISGIGDEPNAEAAAFFSLLPENVAVESAPEIIRPLVYGPDWTLTPHSLDDGAALAVCTPARDLIEINCRWPAEFGAVAGAVTVPVHYVLTEFDGLWKASEDRVAAFARRFRSAPFVEASLWRGAGHNIEHHTLGGAYLQHVLSFAARCAIETRRPNGPSAADVRCR